MERAKLNGQAGRMVRDLGSRPLTKEEFEEFEKSYESQVYRMQGIIERNKHLLHLQRKEKKNMKTIGVYSLITLFILSVVTSVLISWLLLK